MATADLLTPLSAGLDGLSLADSKATSTSYQVRVSRKGYYQGRWVSKGGRKGERKRCRIDEIRFFSFQIVEPTVVPKKTSELLNRIKGEGVQVSYRFTRRPHISSPKLVGVELSVQNTLDTSIGAVSIGETRLQSEMTLRETGGVSSLAPNSTSNFTIGIDFNDTQQPAKFDIW